MLDLAMDIPMLLDTTILARGLLMLSLRPRLMLPFSMVPTDMVEMALGLLMPSPRPRLMLPFSMVPT